MLCDRGSGWPVRPYLLSRFDILGGVIHPFIVRIGILVYLYTEGHECPTCRNPRAFDRSGVPYTARGFRGLKLSTELAGFSDRISGLLKRVYLS
jgi:hypothetical protein